MCFVEVFRNKPIKRFFVALDSYYAATMGGKQSIEQNIDQTLESIIENKCGNVACKNVSDLNINAGSNANIQSIKLKQRCTATAKCAFDAAVDQSLEAKLKALQQQGAIPVGQKQNVKQNIKQTFINKALNECGGVSSENISRLVFNVGDQSTIKDIELDQSGNAQLDCMSKSVLKQSGSAGAEGGQKQAGLLDGVNALLAGIGQGIGSFGMILAGGVVFVLLILMLVLLGASSSPSSGSSQTETVRIVRG